MATTRSGGYAMNHRQPTPSIVVGIDGSDSAITAAQWAIAEAVSRDLPLRLVHVVENSPTTTAPTSGPDIDMEYAETVLREADAAVRVVSEPIKVETAIVIGSPGDSLISESRYAAMVCVGSVGIGRCTRALLGSTATEVAHSFPEQDDCSVLVIRG